MTRSTSPPPRRWTIHEILPVGYLLAALVPIVLRAVGIVGWPWVIALAPVTFAGLFVLGVYSAIVAGRSLGPLKGLVRGLRDETPATPPPDHLDPPLNAEAAGERILAEHPELLAALCLGFRMKQFQPVILGRPVTDAWGVYAAALTAGSMELEQLRLLSRRHAQAYAGQGVKGSGRRPSDAMVMKRAVEHFRRCAEKTITRGGPPDCPFEHVTVVFGTRSPNRDAHLRSLAPRVRGLLERQYPQLSTADLVDGTPVKYSEWRKVAAEERRELARLRREQERLARKVAETETALADARADADALRARMDEARADARTAARAEQQRALDELRASLERAQQEHARQLHRLESENAKLVASLDALAAERDSLERALFDDAGEDASGAGLARADVAAGLRVLLVGGDARQAGPVREYAEARGVQLLHDDTVNAAQLVGGVDVVVFWIRYLSHPKYFAVRRECRIRGVAHGYWTRTSPASLLAVIAEARPAAPVV